MDQTNWRGIQLQEGTFTTGGLCGNVYNPGRDEGHAGATKPFYIDDVKVQRTQGLRGHGFTRRTWLAGGTCRDVATVRIGWKQRQPSTGAHFQGQDGATLAVTQYILATPGAAYRFRTLE